MLETCTKLYSDLPFAHRQPNHDGHCRLVHGHNWAFEVTFSCTEKDGCGFIMDFGKLKPLKEWLDSMFDHTLVLAENDPKLSFFQNEKEHLFDVVTVPDPSCEGLARHVAQYAHELVQRMTNNRVSVRKVTCYEDSKNSATVSAE